MVWSTISIKLLFREAEALLEAPKVCPPGAGGTRPDKLRSRINIYNAGTVFKNKRTAAYFDVVSQ